MHHSLDGRLYQNIRYWSHDENRMYDYSLFCAKEILEQVTRMRIKFISTIKQVRR